MPSARVTDGTNAYGECNEMDNDGHRMYNHGHMLDENLIWGWGDADMNKDDIESAIIPKKKKENE